MRAEIRRYLRKYPTAVLSGLDSAGRPFSIRCEPELDEGAHVLRIALPRTADLGVGPASILCHSHNLFLWNLRSFLVRGSIELANGSWLFRPARFVPGIGVGGLPGMIRFATSKRRSAKHYLDQRGLSRPQIPWAQLRAIQKDSLRQRD
jgi:hypothetical protein